MTPATRQWLAERLLDWVDHSHDVVNAIGSVAFRAIRENVVWDDYIRRHGDVNVPAPALGDAAAAGTQPGAADLSPPSPAFHLMRICPVCHSAIGAPCTTADGKVTGPHRRRRTA